jgi:nicotinic acid phosphoribosyltransferase
VITAYWKKYVDPTKYEALKDFFHHDFARRAATSSEAAFIAGCAHLYFSKGTDTCGAAQWMRKNMGEPDGKGGFLMPGFSVRATEHSVMTQHGREGEMEVFDDIYDSLPDKCIFSCVNDAFDALTHVNAISSGARKDKIISQEIKVVTRNDSDLVVEFTKDSDGRNVLTPQLAELFICTYEYKDKDKDMIMKYIFPADVRRAIQSILDQTPTPADQNSTKPVMFKLTTEQTVLTYLSIFRKNLASHITRNIAKLDVLPAQYGMMCGDGLNPDKISRILQIMVDDGWSPCNMVFGTGGKLYQHGISRDTGNFAMKASQLQWLVELEDGTTYTETKDICKETVGKESIKGRLMVYELDGKIFTAQEGSMNAPNLLQPLVRDGRLLTTLPHIGQIRQFINEQRAARGI